MSDGVFVFFELALQCIILLGNLPQIGIQLRILIRFTLQGEVQSLDLLIHNGYPILILADFSINVCQFIDFPYQVIIACFMAPKAKFVLLEGLS